MMLKCPAMLLPASPVERPRIVQAFVHRVRHRQSVMRVVMREQSLPPEREDSVQAIQPPVDAVKLLRYSRVYSG